MKYLLSLLLSLIISSTAFPQNAERQNNIFFELLGNSVVYSLNYERVVWNNFSVRTGVMIIHDNDDLVESFPILLNYRVHLGNDYVECGIGTTIFSLPFELGNGDKEKAKGALLTGRISYCLTSTSGINLAVSFTPLYMNNIFLPWGGFSIGYSF